MGIQKNIEVIGSIDKDYSMKLKITNVSTKEEARIEAEEWCSEHNSLIASEPLGRNIR